MNRKQRRKNRSKEQPGDTARSQGATASTAPHRGHLFTRLRNYFFAGVLVTAPVGITLWVAWELLTFIDRRVKPLIPVEWNPDTYLKFSLPGIGLILLLVFLVSVGFFFAGIAGRAIVRFGERLLDKVPVVRSIYSATKQIFETIFASRSTAFREVAMIEYPMRGTWAIGFVTGETVGEVQRLTDDTVINVFLPATPNPTTGFLLFVPKRDVHILDMSVEQGIKLVISGGIVAPPEGARRKALQVTAAPPEETEASHKRRRSFGGRLRAYLFAGILVTAPITITVWLAWNVVTFIDARVTPMIPSEWLPETYLPFSIPGIGLLTVLVGLTLIGMFTAGYIGRMVTRLSDRFFERVPFVRSLYSATKQVFETVLAQKSNAFRQCVLFEYPRSGIWSIGFLTGTTRGQMQEMTESKVLTVFLATTPNPTSGFLFFVPEERATLLNMTVEEGLKMVVSGGLVTPPDRGLKKDDVEPEGAPHTKPAA